MAENTTPKTVKQTAANNKFLRNVKKLMNGKIYKLVSEFENEGMHDNGMNCVLDFFKPENHERLSGLLMTSDDIIADFYNKRTPAAEPQPSYVGTTPEDDPSSIDYQPAATVDTCDYCGHKHENVYDGICLDCRKAGVSNPIDYDVYATPEDDPSSIDYQPAAEPQPMFTRDAEIVLDDDFDSDDFEVTIDRGDYTGYYSNITPASHKRILRIMECGVQTECGILKVSKITANTLSEAEANRGRVNPQSAFKVGDRVYSTQKHMYGEVARVENDGAWVQFPDRPETQYAPFGTMTYPARAQAELTIGQKVLTYMGALVTISDIYNTVATVKYADGHEGLFPLYTLQPLKLWHGDTLYKFWAASAAFLQTEQITVGDSVVALYCGRSFDGVVMTVYDTTFELTLYSGAPDEYPRSGMIAVRVDKQYVGYSPEVQFPQGQGCLEQWRADLYAPNRTDENPDDLRERNFWYQSGNQLPK